MRKPMCFSSPAIRLEGCMVPKIEKKTLEEVSVWI
jgi:hypothetical protein